MSKAMSYLIMLVNGLEYANELNETALVEHLNLCETAIKHVRNSLPSSTTHRLIPSRVVFDMAMMPNNKIPAIKEYRSQTGLGLRASKDVIDWMVEHRRVPNFSEVHGLTEGK